MKAIVIEEIGSFHIKDINVPEPGHGEVLVKVNVTGLCRTDLKIIRKGHRDLTLPRVPGEEVVGTITAIGPGTRGFDAGQRVYLYPGISCGTCWMCKSGAGNLCKEMRIMGFHRDGGFAEYVSVPAQCLIPVPDAISDDEAIFTEPLSCCLNALELARVMRDESVGIWGGGPAGTLLMRASAAMGALPYVMETDARRRQLAGGYGRPPISGFDVAVVAVGAREAYEEALEHLGPRGRLVVFSGLPKGADVLPIDFNRFHYMEQTVVGAYGCAYRHGAEALEMIGSGQIEVSDMVSHRMGLVELDEALGLVERRAGMKILLYP